MKNLCKLFGIIALAAIIGFSMTACPTDGDSSEGPPDITIRSTTGTLTINTINAVTSPFIGKRVFAVGINEEDDDLAIFAAMEITSSGNMSLGALSTGSLVLKVWKAAGTEQRPEFDSYSGDDTITLVFFVFDSDVLTINFWDLEKAGEKIEELKGIYGVGALLEDVEFEDGKFAIGFSEILWVPLP
jgi:hypothetical protein